MFPIAAQIMSRVDLDAAIAGALELITADMNDGSFLDEAYGTFVGNEYFWELPGFEEKHLMSFARVLAAKEVVAAFEALGNELTMKGGTLRVFRSLIVEPDWMQSEMYTRPLGVFWSFRRDGAGAYDASPGKMQRPLEVLLTADVPFTGIDWTETVVKRAGGRYAHGEEFEIRLLPSTCVTLRNIEWRDNDFDGWDAKNHSGGAWQQANFESSGLELAAGLEASVGLAIAI